MDDLCSTNAYSSSNVSTTFTKTAKGIRVCTLFAFLLFLIILSRDLCVITSSIDELDDTLQEVVEMYQLYLRVALLQMLISLHILQSVQPHSR